MECFNGVSNHEFIMPTKKLHSYLHTLLRSLDCYLLDLLKANIKKE